jgi:ATP-binding cassette subfamily B protein
MDEIIVISGGRAVERGSHEELLAAGGMYAKLWEDQSHSSYDDEEDDEDDEDDDE